MRGLYISFVIKRRKKIDKIMDYFLILAIFIFIFVFLFYVQFVQKENKYNSTNQKLQKALVELEEVKAKAEKNNQQNASQMEKDYNTAYSELATTTEKIGKYYDYIKDIYAAVIPGVEIQGFTIDTVNSKITLNLSFNTKIDKDVHYRYKSDLLDYEWIPKNGIDAPDTKAITQWEVYVSDGTTIEE